MKAKAMEKLIRNNQKSNAIYHNCWLAIVIAIVICLKPLAHIALSHHIYIQLLSSLHFTAYRVE